MLAANFVEFFLKMNFLKNELCSYFLNAIKKFVEQTQFFKNYQLHLSLSRVYSHRIDSGIIKNERRNGICAHPHKSIINFQPDENLANNDNKAYPIPYNMDGNNPANALHSLGTISITKLYHENCTKCFFLPYYKLRTKCTLHEMWPLPASTRKYKHRKG